MAESLVSVNIRNRLLAPILWNVQLMAVGVHGFPGRNAVKLVELVNVSAIANVIIPQLNLEVFLVKEKWHRRIYATK